MSKSEEIYQRKSIIDTIVLMIFVAVASLIHVRNAMRITEQQCYDELAKSTQEAIIDLENNLREDRTMLRIVAETLAETDADLHSLEISRFLNIYAINSRISEVGILLPDNTVIPASGKDIDAKGHLNFDKLAVLGEHIGGLSLSLEAEDSYVIRSFVPIRRDGKTVAILFSSTIPDNILLAWLPEIYNGHANITVVERVSDGILISNFPEKHRTITGLRDSITRGNISGEELVKNIRDGRSGYAVFQTTAIEGTQFMCYMPMTVADWEMVVSVPKEYVYTSVNAIRHSLYFYLTMIAASLILYFLYLLRIMRTTIDLTERRANVDALTGLQNRNRYENFCEKVAQGTDGLACIYIDANGLHDLNNSKGHLAGDTMLKYVAEAIREEFGEADTYRIGGDEFIAFRYDSDEAQVRADIGRVSSQIEGAGYHIAYGLCMATPERQFAEVIKAAEMEMYENKRQYYKKIGKEMRA